MTVDFALFLTPEGIALAHRQPAGHWALIGETSLDVPDLGVQLSRLRRLGEARAGENFGTLLILPNDQILYDVFEIDDGPGSELPAAVGRALDGRTPYALSELAYDFRSLGHGKVQVAAVAQQTLTEAMDFARKAGFNGAAFTAMPPLARFDGMPIFDPLPGFGPLGLSDGFAIGLDEWRLDDIPEVPAPAPAPPEPEPEPEPEPAAPIEIDEPLAFGDIDDIEAQLLPELEETDIDTTEAPREAEEPEEGVIEAPEPLDAPVAAAPEPVEATGDAAPVFEDATLQPSDASSTAETAEASTSEAEETEDDEEPDPADEDDTEVAAADLEGDAPLAAVSDREPLPEESADAPEDEPDDKIEQTDDVPDEIEAVSAPMGEDAEDEQSTTADEDLEPELAAREETDLPDTDAPAAKSAPPDGTEDAPSQAPALRFGRGSAEAGGELIRRPSRIAIIKDGEPVSGLSISPPETEALRREPRLSLPKSDAPETPPLSTDAPKAARPSLRIPDKLSGTLERWRQRREAAEEVSAEDIGLATPQDALPPSRESNAAPVAEESPAQMAARVALPDPAEVAPERGTPPFAQIRKKALGAETMTPTDGMITGSVMARRAETAAVPSLRTALVITVIFALLLALVAVWSALFLPDSRVAELLGRVAPEVENTAALPAPTESSAAITAPAGLNVPGGDDDATARALADGTLEIPRPRALDTEAAADSDFAALDAETAGVELGGEIPPLAPREPEEAPPLPSLAETQDVYERFGIWQLPPESYAPPPSEFLEVGIAEEIYLASIDPITQSYDALALLSPLGQPDPARAYRSPPPFGTEFDLDENGLVRPTVEGAVSPNGALVVLGRPAIEALPRPASAVASAPAGNAAGASLFGAAADAAVGQAILGAIRPSSRPGDLSERRERQVLGGLTRQELGERRPLVRPESVQEQAAAIAEAAALGATDLAIASSPRPGPRPRALAAEAAARLPASGASTASLGPPPANEASATVTPDIPSSATVSRTATIDAAINLREINLIGVTGTPTERRALIRLPSGRFVRVSVGDRIDGGRVAAIGPSTLQYIKNGRNITLEVPQG
ncbi:MAG: hypothetical protein AAF753_10775 [Pseudomonadota bacterium]